MQDPSHTRSEEEAESLLPPAIELLKGTESSLPAGWEFEYRTLFIGRFSLKPTGYVVVSTGDPASRFGLAFSLDESTESIATFLLKLHQRRPQILGGLDELPCDRNGVFVVETLSGSSYRFDLASQAVTRTPGRHSTRGPRDNVPLFVRRVLRAKLGETGVWLTRPVDPRARNDVFRTSTIIAIYEASETPVANSTAEN